MSRFRRKANGVSASGGPSNKRSRTVDLGYNGRDDDDDDEHIDSASEDERSSDSDSLEEEETLDAKKVRMAKQYLQRIQDASDSDDDDDDSDDSDGDNDDEDDEVAAAMKQHDRVGYRLQKQRLQREGAYERPVADKVERSIRTMNANAQQADAQTDYVQLFRGHDLTATSVALQANGERAVSGSKDHSVILWDVETSKKLSYLSKSWKRDKESQLDRNLGEVLSLAYSDDGRFVACGRKNAEVTIYDVRSSARDIVKTFRGHKGAITALAFRTNSLQLFSGSEDRCLRHYNLNEMIYLETLYGHQFGITGIDCHRKERPISVGRDRTARGWKLAEDTHLIFRGGAKIASADCITTLKDDFYLTGHEDGTLGLWYTEKKKAIKSIPFAHGIQDPSLNIGRGIVSIGCMKGGDLAVTGSNDGFLRFWKVSTGSTLSTRDLQPLEQTIPINGYVNSVAVGPKARFCVVATGQEHRMGRWNRASNGRNRFGIVQLRRPEDIAAEDETEATEMDQDMMPQQDDDDSDSGSDDSGSDSDSS